MSIVMLSHRVKDVKAWRPYYDADRTRRSDAGLKELHVTTRSEDPNDVVLFFETDDVDRAMQMMKDPNLKDMMEQAGVISEPTVNIFEKA